jgi:hypothetical protein
VPVVRRRTVLSAGALALVGLAGCTGDPAPAPTTSSASTTPTPSDTPSKPTVGEVFRDARTFALAAESARVEGMLARGKQRVQVVLEGTASGDDQRVRVEEPTGGTAEVLTVGDGHWLGGDAAYWAGRGESASVAADHATTYLVVSAAAARAVAPWTLRTLLTDRFARPDLAALESDASPVGTDDLDGQQVWVLGSRGRAQLWVAPDGSGELLRMVVPSGEVADLTFGSWGRVTTWPAPSGGDVRTA